MPIPIWERPSGWNPNEYEGRLAFTAGEDLDACPYGESLAGQDWRRGWRISETSSKEKRP